jgi:RNA exonuclease 4
LAPRQKHLSLSITQAAQNSELLQIQKLPFPFQNIGLDFTSRPTKGKMDTTSNGSPKTGGPDRNILTEKVAIDCEMMRSNIGQVLGRVSVVNYEGQTIFDTFVCYPEPIIITNTDEKFSGIGRDDIDPENGAQPFSEVQAQLIEILHDRIVIGHDIQKDLKVISMDLPCHIPGFQRVPRLAPPVTFKVTVRDTQKYSGYRRYANLGAHQGPSLKNLALAILGRPIKQGRVSSVEDAVATMEVYRYAEVDIDREQGQ